MLAIGVGPRSVSPVSENVASLRRVSGEVVHQKNMQPDFVGLSVPRWFLQFQGGQQEDGGVSQRLFAERHGSIRNVKRVSWLVEVTSSVPPWALAISWAMNSPRPSPSRLCSAALR